MFVSVGSATNDMENVGPDTERDRAAVMSFTPDGKDRRIYASGLRNCSAEAIQPGSGALWCAVNERDGLGDNLPPDYATEVQDGGFYGWPWFYIGTHADPRHQDAAARPVGVTFTADGALLVSEDGNGTIWRIAYKGDRP
jgi:glucose/arabinose dehydrogenase